jgi:hypothetical protein
MESDCNFKDHTQPLHKHNIILLNKEYSENSYTLTFRKVVKYMDNTQNKPADQKPVETPERVQDGIGEKDAVTPTPATEPAPAK